MIRLSLLFLAFACCIAFSVADPPLPVLPPQFQVTMEANILQLETTYSQVEYYDFINQKARYEIETVGSSVVIIEDFKTKLAYNITNGVCYSREPITALGGSIRSTNDLLMFGKEYNETYMGVSTVRGVPCDGWISEISYISNSTDVPPKPIHHILTLQFYFTVESWGFREENVTRKPMRALLNGTRIYSDGTRYNITNYYEFVDFVAKPAASSLFVEPVLCGTVVVPGLVSVWDVVNQPEGAGLVAGMFFLGLFIGIIAMAIVYAVKRRRERQRNFNQRSMPLADRADNEN